MIVNCHTEFDISLDDNDKEVITKAYEILENIRYECFIQANDSDDYRMAESITKNMCNLMKCAGLELRR